jgi:DNA-binding MarR family transcriptional regulator
MAKLRPHPEAREGGRSGGSRQARPFTPPPVRPGYYDGALYRPHDSVGYLMRLTVEMVSRAIEARMAEYGLTDAQWRPLFMLSLQEDANASQLAKAIHCDSGATTRLLDRLEEKGLLRRVRSTDDRRVQRLEITEEGRKAAAVVPYVVADVLNAHLSGLGKEEVDKLRDMLQRILATGAANAAGASEEGRKP